MKRHLVCLMLLLMLAACTPSAALPTRAAVAVVPTTAVATTATATPIPPYCAQSGRIETGVFSSQTAGPTAYRIYLPPCYGRNEGNGRTYPTLYMLPGNNQTDAIWDELGLDEAAEAAIQSGQLPPFLIVMPDGGQIAHDSSGGPNSYETVILNDLIPAIEADYCAWPSAAGRAIGGLSRGGYWALEIAFRHPEQFASVGGHSAALLDIAAKPDVNPQQTALTNDLGDLRIYLDIGKNDGGIENTQQLHEDMTAQKRIHTWVLNDGGHDTAYWTSHLMAYLTWYAIPWPLNRDQYPACPPK